MTVIDKTMPVKVCTPLSVFDCTAPCTLVFGLILNRLRLNSLPYKNLFYPTLATIRSQLLDAAIFEKHYEFFAASIHI